MEAQLRAVLAAHAQQARRELDRWDLVRCTVDPDGALGAARGVVDAADEIPRERLAVGALPDTRRPPPLGVARVIAGGVVDHRSRAHLARRPAADRERPARGYARLLSRPHVLAPVRAARLDPRFFV